MKTSYTIKEIADFMGCSQYLAQKRSIRLISLSIWLASKKELWLRTLKFF